MRRASEARPAFLTDDTSMRAQNVITFPKSLQLCSLQKLSRVSLTGELFSSISSKWAASLKSRRLLFLWRFLFERTLEAKNRISLDCGRGIHCSFWNHFKLFMWNVDPDHMTLYRKSRLLAFICKLICTIMAVFRRAYHADFLFACGTYWVILIKRCTGHNSPQNQVK